MRWGMEGMMNKLDRDRIRAHWLDTATNQNHAFDMWREWVE